MNGEELERKENELEVPRGEKPLYRVAKVGIKALKI